MDRNRFSATLFGLVVAVFAAGAQSPRQIVFSDDFSSYSEDAALRAKWSPFAGHWYVKDGTLHQDDGSYDCGIVVRDLFLRCDYRVEAKVRLVAGGAGAGLYWAVGNQDTGENGNMLRFDGNIPIMYGWMHGRGFAGTGGATGELYPDGKWHAIRMDVRPAEGTFDLYWDDKRIADHAPMFHKLGYVGLECSMGHSEFSSFVVSVEQGVDWHSSPKNKVAPEHVESVAVLPDGSVVYPVRSAHRVQVVSPDGKLLREFGEHGSEPGRLDSPCAVAAGRDGRLYVLEAGNKRYQAFSPQGASLGVGPIPGIATPVGIAVEPGGRVWVSDAGTGRLFCLEGGKVVKEVGGFNGPRHLAFAGGLLYVAETNSGQVAVVDPDEPSPVRRVPLGASPRSAVPSASGLLYVATGAGIEVHDAAGKLVKSYTGASYGYACAEQIALDPAGDLVAADAWNQRILRLSPNLAEPTPTISHVTATSATVTWTTDAPTAGRVLLVDKPSRATIPSSVDYSSARAIGDPKLTTKHEVKLTGLRPATRYVLAIDGPVRTIPSGGRSIDYRFTTPAPKGKMAYSEVPIAILTYMNVTFESQKRPDGTVPPPSHKDGTFYEHSVLAHEGMRLFYWRNSYFRLDTKCFNLKVTRPVDFANLGSSSEEVYKDLATLAEREHMRPTDFGAVLVIGGNGTYAYPWPTPWWGGSLTYTTGCCFAGPGDLWLSTHEFHHLTEGWMGAAGNAGYTCADTPWLHPGRFGENFDFLAHTLRFMAPEKYLNLSVGKIVVTNDVDGDGVPDDEPRCALDKKRAGIPLHDRYSYGNGLTNLQNQMAEILFPATRGLKTPLLKKEVDLKHPFAVFDYGYERHKKTPKIDGRIDPGEWDLFAKTPNAITPPPADSIYRKIYARPPGADLRMQTFLNWDDAFIYVAARAPFKFMLSPQLDCAGDGYFHGNDNLIVGFQIPRDENSVKPYVQQPVQSLMVWNNVEPVKDHGVPDWDNARFDKKDKIRWAWGKDRDGWYDMEIAIPRCAKIGLEPKPGKEMGIRFYIRGMLPPTPKDADPFYAFEMFDNCEYCYFKLVK